MSLFPRLLGRRFLLFLVADGHEDMAGSLGDAVASALGARLKALERHGLLDENPLHPQLIHVGAVVVLGVGNRRFEHLLDDARSLLRTEGEQIERFSHGQPADLVRDEPPLLGRQPHPVKRCAGFHGHPLLLLAARGRGCRRRGGGRSGRSGRSSGGSVRSTGSRCRGGFQNLLVRHSVALEDARQRELAELVSDHVLGDVYGDVLLAVMDGDRQPDEIREDGRAPRPRLDRALLVGGARRADLFHQVVVHEWTLLDRASHGLALVSLLVPELDDHAARALVLARLVALGEHPPGTHRILPCRGFSLAAAMRVVDRVHRDPAHRGPDSAPAYAPGLADRFQAVLLVADFADGGAAIHVYFADLPGTQAHLGVAALAGEKLHRGAGRARELRAPTRLHLDAVNRGADRNVPERQRIARLDRRLHARQKLHSGREALGGDDVAAFAVGVTEQREVCAPVRIVFQPLDLRGDTVLVAAEIDDAVMLLVAAPLVAHGDMAVDVAARLLRLLLDQRLVRPAFVQVRVYQLDELPPAGRCGFDFDERHGLLRSLEADLLPLGERDVGLFPLAAVSDVAPKALFLAPDVGDLDRFHLGLEHELDRSLDFGLGRVGRDAENVLVVLFPYEGALLRDLRREQHLHQPLLRRARVHFRISSNFVIAFFVRIT